MKVENLSDLFLHTLKDIYYAEKQILKALPKMAKAAKSPELKKAFETHKTETEGQVERLSEVFELIGKAPRAKTCDAILGILEEGKAVMEDYADSPALDAGLVASAQAVEPSYMDAFATSIAVSAATCVWNSNRYCSVPWVISGWYGVYEVRNSPRWIM